MEPGDTDPTPIVPGLAERRIPPAGNALKIALFAGWVVLTHPWLEWLWSSANYHEVHHKFPHLAHCELKPVFEATRHDLPYLTVSGYTRCLQLLRDRAYYPAARTGPAASAE